MPGEITHEHLSKKIYIYVRQSSPHQVKEHRESRRLQYNLKQHALKLGWPAQNIVVVDDDLGITATGTKERSGFETILSALCHEDVGALMFSYASRLARNGREWYQVLEFCGIVNCLIIDTEGIYDSRIPGDRMWLGMKATFSEYEVRQMQASARAAILSKASRAELFSIVPAGLIRTDNDKVEFDPDLRIQQAIRGIFEKFDELASVNQVYLWYQHHGIEVPVRDVINGGKIVWRIPGYPTIYRVLKNPLLAGSYEYPRTKTITRIVDGKLKKTAGHRTTPDDQVFFHQDLFPGYISWEKYQQNQKIIENNANMKGNAVPGAAREGKSLLAGLLYSSHCGCKMNVRYYSGKSSPYYFCPGSRSSVRRNGCLSFSGGILEAAITREIFGIVQPTAIEAAFKVEEQVNLELHHKADAFYHALEQARYEAGRIERQFNAADPENYLVTRELSSRWQKALEKVEDLQNQYNRSLAQHRPLSEEERVRIFDLAKDLEHVWNHPGTDFRTKTLLVRLLIKAIWIKKVGDTKLKATIHWQGGIHTEIEIKRKRRGKGQKANKEQDVIDLIRQLARVCDDSQITRIFNLLNCKNKNGQSWLEAEIAEHRKANNIPAFSQQKYEQCGLINLSQAAKILEISFDSVSKLIKCGIIKAEQVIAFAPWEIERTELEKSSVLQAVAAIKKKIPFNDKQVKLDI